MTNTLPAAAYPLDYGSFSSGLGGVWSEPTTSATCVRSGFVAGLLLTRYAIVMTGALANSEIDSSCIDSLIHGTNAIAYECPGLVIGPSIEASEVRKSTEYLRTLRAGFGLSLARTSTILRVSRPTVYSWIAGEALPRTSNRKRLIALAGLATFWNEQSNRALFEILDTTTQSGAQLVSLLSRKSLHEIDLRTAMLAVLKEYQHRPMESVPLRERARARGLKVDPGAGQRRIDRASRRRFTDQ